MKIRAVLPLGVFLVSTAFAQSAWNLGPFHRPVDVPVIEPNKQSTFTDPITKRPVHWESLHTFNPAAIVRDGRVHVLYRAEDDSGEMVIGKHTSRLGLAVSDDGVHFTRQAEPVFYPANDGEKDREWPGGVEDPRIVEGPDGTYVLTYTQWNRKSTGIGIATSKDLVHWQKHGPMFPSLRMPPFNSYKSGGVVTELRDGRLKAAKINGKFWMFWGEVEVHLATSNDLVHWEPLMDAKGEPVVVLRRRDGLFDSAFPETGPPPVLTRDGIVMLYNGKNGASGGAEGIDSGAYSVGQALFSAKDPSKLLAREQKPFFKPELPFERSGQYLTGTTFAEGLVWFKGKWLLYYGCADSLVGVATTK